MLNKEKYAKEIIDIVCQEGSSPAVVNNVPIKCTDVSCHNCKFYGNNSCSDGFVKWANSEYKEREIDWSKVPVDTPIYVWDEDNYNNKLPRHFASFNHDTIGTFSDGQTSWTMDDKYGDIVYWEHAEIKEGIDCSQWYKD